MKPLFTVHAGEYLVGSYIEKRFKKYDVWIPSKDTGVDLLITNPRKPKRVSLQVKFSKDFLAADMQPKFKQNLLSCGWWTLRQDKIKKSKADFWIFVLYTFDHRQTQYIVIRPKELLQILKHIHGNSRAFNVYFWVTKERKCWETRGLSSSDQTLLSQNMYSNSKRNLTRFLNNWKSIKRNLG
jgi:hypothetical protein